MKRTSTAPIRRNDSCEAKKSVAESGARGASSADVSGDTASSGGTRPTDAGRNSSPQRISSPDRRCQTTDSFSKWPVDLPTPGTREEREDYWVEVYARAHLPTRYGNFKLFAFRTNVDDQEHLALVRGQVQKGTSIPVRIHSECLTGDVLTSLRCDCRDQLEQALSMLGREKAGILIYLRQEGRGIGLGNKIRAYALQEEGLDTIEANQQLGFASDLRDYRVAALILNLLQVESVQLITNNPLKIVGLESRGIFVAGRLCLLTKENPHNEKYLQTKAKKAGHLMSR